MNTSTLTVPFPPVAGAGAMWPCIDAASQMAWPWIEFQRGLWQPWLDMQVRCWQQLNVPGGWPLPITWMMRGTEQLA